MQEFELEGFSTVTKKVVVACLVFATIEAILGAPLPALASPLTDSIADVLDKDEATIKTEMDRQDYCPARKRTDEVIEDLETAIDESADGKPIDMKTISSLHVQASGDDASWIIDRKNQFVSVQHALRLFCP
jgi:hypothetical protein